MNYQQPDQPQYMQSNQPVQPQATQPAHVQGSATFTADAKTLQLLASVHPELTSAMINLAIKKFAEEPDFLSYFVKEEYKQMVEQTVETRQEEQPAEQPSAGGMDFASW